MDNDAENVEENEKYSFLLGSAIRNEDPEQFLSIYDAILPKNLPGTQVDYIKDKARQIADLPEEDFSQLVSRARNFSLAQDRVNMSYVSGRMFEKTSSDEEDIHLSPYGIRNMTYTQYTPKETCIIDMESSEKRTDNDSGICNSSKATTSVGSYSDQEESEGDERGCFDYFPPHNRTSSVKISPTTSYPLDFDEAHEVESDKNDIESPRSGKGSDSEPTFRGIEMRTYSRSTHQNEDADFETSDESDNEVRPHQRLYGERRRNKNYYTPMTLESSEDYEAPGSYSSSFSFENSQKALRDRSASSLREVDEQVKFPMYSRHSQYSNYGSTSSDRVKIEKNSYQRSHPPFGQGFDQLHKVGSSIGELISGTKQTVDGMPEGRPISQSLDLASDDGKKKKKKKRGSKDDLDEKSKRKSEYSDTDENGNPRLECAPLLHNNRPYRQMREAPKSSLNSSVPKNYDSFPRQISNLGSYPFSGGHIRDIDDPGSQVHQDANRKVSRKKVKKDKAVERKSEEIENYQGNKEIDEVLSFIENDGNGRKPKKVQHTNSFDLASSKSNEKVNKKNKDKKQKLTQGEIKSSDKKDTINENLKDKEEVIEIQETEDTLESIKSEMGNSNEKITEQEIPTETCKNDIMDNNIRVEKVCEKEITKNTDLMNGDISPEEVVSKSVLKKAKEVGQEKKIIKEKAVNHKIENEAPCVLSETKTTHEAKNKEDNNSNNVKQNNIKNSRKKNNVNVSEQRTSETADKKDMHKNEPKNNIVLNEDVYIFTDIDSLKPVEEEFQVVGKKKKKGSILPTKEGLTKETVIASRIPVREERRKPQRSITPPPALVNSLGMQTEKDRMRDLSPSSFPALGAVRQGRPSFRDGRRNSTGDVPKEILIKPQDDSDLESVKSLPASGQAVSPRLQISYAKMAASPKPSGTSLTNSNSDDADDSVDHSETAMSAVWKGSPTERRHSIGSSPEGKETDSCTLRQKFGSQELVKSGQMNDGLLEPSSSSGATENPSSNSDLALSESSSKHSVNSIATNDLVDVSKSSLVKGSDYEQDTVKRVQGSISVEKVSPYSQKNHGANTFSSQGKVTKTSSCETVKSVKSPVLSKQNNFKRQTRSVIFLDRGEKEPQNLGITFGFEPEISLSNSNLTKSPQTRQDCNEGQNNDFRNSSKPENSASIIYSKSVSNKSPISCSNSSENRERHSSKNSKSTKFPLEGKNGVVKSVNTFFLASDSKILDSQKISFLCDDTSLPLGDNLKIPSENISKGDNSNFVRGDNHIIVHFGDAKECMTLLGDECVNIPARQLKFIKEADEKSGRFNKIDITNYLRREWDTIENMLEKNPGSVMIYNQQ